jgi:ribonuclease HI
MAAGATQCDLQLCGEGGVLNLRDTHVLKVKAGLDHRSDNYAELMTLKLILILATKKDVSKIEIFDDSQMVINWMQEASALETFLLRPIFEEIRVCLGAFDTSLFIMFLGKGMCW